MLATGAAVLVLAAPVAAERKESSPLACGTAGQRCPFHSGTEFSLSAGVGGLTDDTPEAFTEAQRTGQHAFWPGFGAQLWYGRRFLHWLSLGANVGYQNMPTRDLPSGAASGSINSVTTGAYARFYFGRLLRLGGFEPSIMVGVNPYAAVWMSYRTATDDTLTRVTSVAIPGSLHLEYYVTSYLAAGLMGQAAAWIPYERCHNAPGGPFICSGDNLKANAFLYAGATLRATLPF